MDNLTERTTLKQKRAAASLGELGNNNHAVYFLMSLSAVFTWSCQKTDFKVFVKS